ncbi:Peptidase M15 [Acinetobacter proteolyticus]|uniref:Peptidase M15 n=1 Tax=Acinetobacter proteolyticus TaxID=1776741 RepID=A0A653KBI7_9GAMM|nr:D-Ala-D-Ala carboxypeptidase family metallohydrolase [Acinetobacter proteolyticus]VXA58370.1 Peptidase M15 [Acinetobacter proteolyticus]
MKKIYLFGCICALSACHSPHQTIQPQHTALPQANLTRPELIVQEKQVPSSYQSWMSQPKYQQQIQAYKKFLKRQGLNSYIPDFEFFQTARDWQKCNYVEYEIPPRELWGNIVPTLNILNQWIEQKLIDQFTVTSVYRNYELNRCAGGANASRHVFNAALDFRIGSENPNLIEQTHIEETKAKLCQFWQDHGEALNFGLGVYASGQIHIDTAGYRTWGVDHRYSSSPCINNLSKNNKV